MSPVPPPAGTFIPSDDWTDDPSFDLSPSASHFALPPSPSSSSTTSSRSRASISSIREHAASPLRNVFPGGLATQQQSSKSKSSSNTMAARASAEMDIDDGDFDLPDSFPAFASRSSSLTSTGSMGSLSKMVVGTGPKGIGTITKLGSTTPSKLALLQGGGTVRARAKALEAAWEADLDFDALPDDVPAPLSRPFQLPSKQNSAAPKTSGGGTIRRLQFSPSKIPRMPPADALDELGFDDLGEENDEDQATLKAGATIKALLPPPKPKAAAIPSTPKGLKETTPPMQDPSAPDGIDGMEDDFVLPLNLTNLSLVTQQPIKGKSKPRASNASTVQTDWDSPGTSTSGRKSAGAAFKWESESSPRTGKHSMSSATSLSDRSTPAKPPSAAGKTREDEKFDGDDDEEDAEDNMEDGLVLPSPTFFAAARAKDLNAILDKKRKPQFAPPPLTHRRTDTNETFRTGDESMEDGLVFDNPKVELSNSRLRHSKKARNVNHMGTYPPKGSRIRGTPADRDRAWEKSREQGWGRHTPLPSVTPRERTQSSYALLGGGSGGVTGPRSHSDTSIRADMASGGTFRRPESPLVFSRDAPPRATSASSGGTSSRMLPPPIPTTPSSTARGLRHQKSHFHLPHHTPLPSPGLARKQSLASLQDALSHPPTSPSPTAAGDNDTFNTPVPAIPARYHNSTSRLTMPTSSSRAKIRPPISSVFPRLPESGSRDSVSSGASANHSFLQTPMGHPPPSIHGGGRRAVEMQIPKRAKDWGDGTELEGIEDLQVDEGGRSMALGLGKPGKRDHEPRHGSHTPRSHDIEKRRKSGAGPNHNASGLSKRSKGRKPALLRNLTTNDRKRVVGEMTWNPSTLRWEGNETILRDFEHIPTSSSTRPALITHFTGGSTGLTSPTGSGAGNTATIRIVGDMKFDPARMCWVNVNVEDEVDPFSDMADDEDEDLGGTITRSAGRKLVSVGLSSVATTGTNWSSRLASEASSLATSIASGISGTSGTSAASTGSGRGLGGGSGGSQYVGEGMVTEGLYKECKEAEERHRRDVKGWILRSPMTSAEVRERDRREEKRLWEIRNLAMKS